MLFDRVPFGLPARTQVLEVTFDGVPGRGDPIQRDVTYVQARVKRVLAGTPTGPVITVRVPGGCHVYERRASGLLVGRFGADMRAPRGLAFLPYETRPDRRGRDRLVDVNAPTVHGEYKRIAFLRRVPRRPQTILRRPSAAEILAAWPAAAKARRRGGGAQLACTLGGNGRLYDCRLLEEGPPGAGFGAATLRMAALYRFVPPRHRGDVPPSVQVFVRWDPEYLLLPVPVAPDSAG
jgi:TonB family protein